MVLKFVEIGNSLPLSLPVDPVGEFEPGMIAQLYTRGNNIVCGVSDGRAPFGIIDDIKTRAFTAPSIDEEVIAMAPAQNVNGKLVTPIDIKWELKNPNIIPQSFTTNPVNVHLVPRNGIVIFPAGTALNFDLKGTGVPDSIRTIVSYTYQIPNIPGDDSTASGKVTVWFQRGVFQTDMYETNQRYPLNQILFVSENGKLTSSQPNEQEYPGVAMVTGPPTSVHGLLEFIWL